MAKKNDVQVTYVDEQMLDGISWEVVQDIAKEVRKDFKRDPRIPEDTGLYKSSIAVKKSKKDNTATVWEDAKKKGRRKIGHLLEDGTPNTPAQPHWVALEEEWLPFFEEELADEIQKFLEKEGY